MSVLSIEALTRGNFFKACTAAITKNPINPSLTPCSFSNSAPYLDLSSLIGCISTSLKVVNIAVSCLTDSNLFAIVALNLLIGTLFSSLESENERLFWVAVLGLEISLSSVLFI